GDAAPPAGAAAAPAPPAPRDANPLTPREREILRLVARGLGDAQIAAVLVLSPHTVHRHVANIRRKLGQPTRAAAAADATGRGLLGEERDG
ncbi:helix-turn-helix transcriptional regulator, partial [Conexibacter stalactiti]